MFHLISSLTSILGKETLYLDPGSGSFLLQLLLAGLLGLGIALRAYWGKILGLFGIKSKPKDEETDDEE